jgi:uncharacterized membrane protein (DUF106 family)
MLDRINNAILSLADPALNWLLTLPTDLALLIVAIGTGAIITFSRLFTTNQDLLRRCDQDKRRLKELVREAKRQKDKAAVQRYRTTMNMIGVTTLKAEGWPLLAAIVPIGILGTWCFQRIAFVPPRAGDTVPMKAYFPVSAVGGLAHVVPQEGVREVSVEESGQPGRWIQEIVEDYDNQGNVANSVATWYLQAEASPDPYVLEIRYKTCTQKKELLVGQQVYAPDVEFYAEDQPVMSAQLEMKPVKFLGGVPEVERWHDRCGTAVSNALRYVHMDWLIMPPWLVAYFVIAIPSVSLLKRVTGIY